MGKGRQVQYLVTSAVCLAGVVVGVVIGWSTPVIAKFNNNETNINITDNEISWMAAIASPGYMTGSLLTSFVADRFGRRASMLASAFPILTGTIMILSTAKAWGLYLTRFLWGVGIGVIQTISAMYLTEVSDKEIRGATTSAYRFMQSFGSFLIMTVGPFVSYHDISYMLLILPICYFIACCFIPETPYFFLKEGKVDAARASLIKLSGNKDEKELEDHLSAMRSDVRKETLRSGSIIELFTGKQYRKALLITIGLKGSQVMSGSIAIQQYLGRIIQDSKTSVNVSTVLIVFGAVRFILGIFSSVIVDRIGRRPLLLYSYLSSGVILIIVGVYFLIQPSTSPLYGYIPFIGIIFSTMFSVIGYETLVFVILAEIFPLNVKSVAMTFQNILGGFLNFFAVKGYQEIKNVAGLTGVFWFYGVFALMGAVVVLFLVTETKGKSLREIQVELQGALYDEADEKLRKEGVGEDMGVTELKELKRDEASVGKDQASSNIFEAKLLR